MVNKATEQLRKKAGRTGHPFVANIVVGDRLRPVTSEDPDVISLAESMKRYGLETPITVWQREGAMPLLIAGARRLAAAKLLGWETIEAFVHVGLTDDEAKALEVIENYERRDLTPKERREHTKILLTLEEAIDAAAKEAKNGKEKNTSANAEEIPKRGRGQPEGIVSKVAKKTGQSVDTVARINKERLAEKEAAEKPPLDEVRRNDLALHVETPAADKPAKSGRKDQAAPASFDENDPRVKKFVTDLKAFTENFLTPPSSSVDNDTLKERTANLIARCEEWSIQPPEELAKVAETVASRAIREEGFMAFLIDCVQRRGCKPNEKQLRLVASGLVAAGYTPPKTKLTIAPSLNDMVPVAAGELEEAHG